jgi:hypothetical protein
MSSGEEASQISTGTGVMYTKDAAESVNSLNDTGLDAVRDLGVHIFHNH